MPWKNRPLRLYHGTDDQAANNIKSHGVDLSKCSPFTDFGQGFYTTTHLAQAWSWAVSRCKLNGAPPAVLTFEVDREGLGHMSNLFLTHEDDVRTGFWSLVEHCRLGLGAHIPSKQQNYATVSGPVSLWPQPLVIKDCDQISFHSTAPQHCRISREVDEAVRKGRVLLEGDLLTPGSSDPKGSFVEWIESKTEQALRLLGSEHIRALMAPLRSVSTDPLFLHFDPRQLACLLAGVSTPTPEQLLRLSKMRLVTGGNVHRPKRRRKQGPSPSAGQMESGAD